MTTKKFRFLHIADLHLDHAHVDMALTSKQGAQLRKDRVLAIDRLLTMAIEQHLDAVCIAGDVFDDETVEPATINFLEKAFARLGAAGVSCFYAPGRSDVLGEGSLSAYIQQLPWVHVFKAQWDVVAIPRCDAVVIGKAWSPSRVVAPEAWSLPRASSALVLAYVEDASELDPLFERVESLYSSYYGALGGEHDARILKQTESCAIAYAGSLVPCSFDEMAERTFFLGGLSGDVASIDQKAVGARRIIAVDFNLSDLVGEGIAISHVLKWVEDLHAQGGATPQDIGVYTVKGAVTIELYEKICTAIRTLPLLAVSLHDEAVLLPPLEPYLNSKVYSPGGNALSVLLQRIEGMHAEARTGAVAAYSLLRDALAAEEHSP